MITAFLIYALLIVLASLFGGWVPMLIRLTHRRMQVATSLIAGFMLGVALLHLLPHALMTLEPWPAMIAVLAGVLAMFFLERFFHFHQHIAPGEEGKPPVTADPEPGIAEQCEDAPGDPIDHHHGHTPEYAQLSWVGVSIGLLIHSLIAGAALAAAMSIGANDAHAGHAHADAAGLLDRLPGFAVFLVIVLHRPFDSMTLLTLLKTTGWSRGLQHTVNVLFALAVPLGSVLFFVGLAGVDFGHSTTVGYALAVAAGVFLCVSLADLLPEVHFHRHDRVLLSAAVLIGLGLASAIAYFESQSHAHEHGNGHGPQEARQLHDDHPEPVAPKTHDDHAGHDHHDHAGHDH